MGTASRRWDGRVEAASARPAWLPVVGIALALAVVLAFVLGGQRGSAQLPGSIELGSLAHVVERAAAGPVQLAAHPEVAVVAVRVDEPFRSSPRWGSEDGIVQVSDRLMLIALDLRDPRGGTVTWCASSGRFENAATGGAYSLGGRWRAGPSPRGLDRFGLDVRGTQVVVDTTRWVAGMQQDRAEGAERPEGPACH